jgi:hypothetical protein
MPQQPASELPHWALPVADADPIPEHLQRHIATLTQIATSKLEGQSSWQTERMREPLLAKGFDRLDIVRWEHSVLNPGTARSLAADIHRALKDPECKKRAEQYRLAQRETVTA